MLRYLTSILFIYLLACTKPEPVSFKANVGMPRKEVIKLLGKPSFTDGFVESLEDTQVYTPQRDRFFLMFVYPDNSLVVLKHDTVYEVYGNASPFQEKLMKDAIRRSRRRQNSK